MRKPRSRRYFSWITRLLPLFVLVVIPDRGSGMQPPCGGDAPCALTAVAAGSDEITITWEGADDAAHRIQWVEGGTTPDWDTDSVSVDIALGTFTYSHTGLKADTKYWYQISACADGFAFCVPFPGATLASNERVATATTEAAGAVALDPPAGFTVSTNSDGEAGSSKGQIDIGWTAVENVVYELRWDSASVPANNAALLEGDPDLDGGSAGARVVTHDERTVGKEYSYQVRAASQTDDGSKTPSDWVTAASATAGGQLSKVTNLGAVLDDDETTATVTWDWEQFNNDHLLEITYKVQRGEALAGPWEDLPDAMGDANGADPKFVVVMDEGLTAGTTYFYQVQATLMTPVTGAAPSEWAKTSTGGNVAPDPDPVEGFEAEAAGPAAIKLSWKAVEDVPDDDNDDISFEIEHNTVGADETDWLTTGKPAVSSTEHTHSGLDPETEYWYRIRAANVGNDGVSDWSEVVSATTGEDIEDDNSTRVKNLAATRNGTTIELSWGAPDSTIADFKEYLVEWKLNSGEFRELTRTKSRSYDHEDRTAAGRYRYRVAAVDDDGKEYPWSREALVTIEEAKDKPSAPRDLTASAAGSTVTLSWEAPADSGDASITKYKIENSLDGGTKWTTIKTVGAAITTYEHTGLDPNETIHYRVSATNEHGYGPVSDIVSATTERDTPSAPRSLTVQGVERGNQLTWRAPSEEGASALTGYRVEQSTDGGASWTTVIVTADASVRAYLHLSPPPGQETSYRVIAINDKGDSPPSNVVKIETEAIPPSRPTSLRASVSGDIVRLSWSAPSNTGGAAITGYRIEVASFADALWNTLVEDTESTETEYSYKVEPGTTLSYRVFAINSAGRSRPSTVVRVTVDAVAPSPPTGVGALAVSHDAIGVAWNEPANTGGAPVTGYRIEYSNDGGFWNVLASNFAATSTAYRHTDLKPATQYFYRVFAINKAGRSGPSEVVNATTLADLPGVPERLIASVISPTQINLTWDEPRYTGGVALTGYSIESSPDGESWIPLTETAGDETFYQHRGLRPATTYHYRVTSRNEIGSSKASRPVFARTTAALPDKPVELKATAKSDSEIYLTWMKPSFDGGAAITGYLIEVSTDQGSSWSTVRSNTGSTNTVFTHTGLKRATIHQYRVAAINKIGNGEKSEVAEAKTFALVPGAPVDLKAKVISSTQIDLKWTPPEDDGGAPINRYQIEVTEDHVEWSRLTDVDQGVEYSHIVLPGATWNYRVKARNEAGYGLPSNVVTATTDDPLERTERVMDAILPRFTATAVSSSIRAITTRIDLISNGYRDNNRINVLGGRDGLRGIINGSTVSQSAAGASIWGSADLTSLSENGTIDWGGEVFSVHAGLDGMLRDGILVGLAGSRSKGEFKFTDQMGARDIEGDLDVSLTSMNPYLAWIREDMGVWTATGFGWGSIDITDDAADRSSTLASSMLSAGGFRHILSSPVGVFRIRAEGISARIEVAGNVPSHLRAGVEPGHINESSVRVRRGRLMLDWMMPRKTYGEYHADFRFEGGVRYDQNELETGVNGSEFGGGLRLTGPVFRAQADGRVFIHPDYREWGIQGLVELRSRQENGVSLRVQPAYGNAQSGLNQLWENGVADAVAEDVGGRVNAVLAYQSLNRGVPYGRVDIRDGRMDIYTGFRYRLMGGLDFKTEAIHRKGKPGLSLQLRSAR